MWSYSRGTPGLQSVLSSLLCDRNGPATSRTYVASCLLHIAELVSVLYRW